MVKSGVGTNVKSERRQIQCRSSHNGWFDAFVVYSMDVLLSCGIVDATVRMTSTFTALPVGQHGRQLKRMLIS